MCYYRTYEDGTLVLVELLAKLGHSGIREAGVVLALDLLNFLLQSAELILTNLHIGLDFRKLLLQGVLSLEALVELGVELLDVHRADFDFGLSSGGQRAQRHNGSRKNGEFHNM